VVVVEDHPMMLAAIEQALGRAGIAVVASTASAADGYRAVGELSPDVVVVDIGLPDESGIDLTRRLLRRSTRVTVVIHTGIEDPVALKDALDCGARAFAYKTGGPASLVAAVRAAAAGNVYVARELRDVIAAGERTDRPRLLTDRERQVLALVADGLPVAAIAEQLMLSGETVRTHIRNAMRKLGAHTRTHAVVEALRAEELSL
jgi:DNA-binding NarL/FixJ family response regulator